MPDSEGAFYQTARRSRVPLHHANMIGSAEDDRKAFRCVQKLGFLGENFLRVIGVLDVVRAPRAAAITRIGREFPWDAGGVQNV